MLCLFYLSIGNGAVAQNVVTMPHQGVDTLYISPTGCYTILDPGGTGKYENNEDSWLLIVGEQYFYIEAEFELGHNDDGKDWVRVYYDTVDWYGYDQLGGIGTREMGMWNNRAMVHFHSNAYNTFDGFQLKIVQVPTVYNLTYSQLSTTSVRLQWDDNNNDASQWTVFYSCDDDSIASLTVNNNWVVLNNLQPDRYYRYYIVNNIVACPHREYGWFATRSDSTLLLMHPNNWHVDTIPPDKCYSIIGPTGDTASIDLPYSSAEYYLNDGHGIYLQQRFRTLNGEVSTERLRPDNNRWGNYYYHWDRTTERTLYEWFPKGFVRTNISGRSRFHYDILPENSSYLVPTVSAITASSATISWTDASPATAWTFRYCKEEGQWTELSTTTPSVTLNGLEPGRQYVYTILGNIKRNDCDVAARHGFTTSGNSDTIIMPYRGNASVTLQPRMCYTILDAGKNGGYFNTDFSRLVLRTANHKGFRIEGRCMLSDEDRIFVFNGERQVEFSQSNYDIQVTSVGDSIVIMFQTNVTGTSTGFAINVLQVDDSISNLHTVSTGTTAATIAWNDNSDATQWTVTYGLSEDAMQSITVNTKQATLSALQPGSQYVYQIIGNISGYPCSFSERKGFITQGLPDGNVLMPYRDIDTLILSPYTCYKIWDAGGKNHNYFNNDTSVLVILSNDGSDFTIDGQWLMGGNEALFNEQSYDNQDYVQMQIYADQTDYWWSYDAWHNRFANNDRIRLTSSNGYLRIRFISNSHNVRPGFCLTVDRSQGEVSDVKLTRVTTNSATVNWNDNSGSSMWSVSYGPVGGMMTTTMATQRNFTMNNLIPNTDYQVSIYTGSTSLCEAPATFFTTLPSNSIVMTPHGDDTVYITPGQCYFVYDPGGSGDYLPSDTSRLVLRSTTGEGFYYSASANVGNSDYSDQLYVSPSGWGRISFWWGWEQWVNAGDDLTIEITTNEALQDKGFWMIIRFPSRVYNPDTLNMTDSTVTITWLDTTSATQWNFSYGTHIDSMTTVTVSTKQYTMTGLERNRQYFYSIYNTVENPECVLENIYGVIMPCDAGVFVDPYRNHFLNYAGRYSLYYQNSITLTPDQCYHFLSEGGLGNIFHNSDNYFDIHTVNNQGITIEGYYDLGSSSLWISTSQSGSWYSNTGYLKLYAPDGNVNFQQRAGTSQTDFAPGFDFEVTFNYKIYNVRTQNVTCTSAKLLWDDSTSATQWTLAYGPTEKELDTLVLNTKSVNLTGLLPDHQYVCYLTSNDNTLSCLKPVKYCFITTCDTTIFVAPYNKDTVRILDINECYTILDGGSQKDYLYNDRHQIYLQSSNGNAMTLRGNVDFGENDYIYLWDDITGEWLGSYGRQDNVVIHVPSGRLHMEYNSAGDTVTGSGMELHVTFHSVSNIKVDLKTDTTCRLTWNDNSGATQWICYYGRERNQMDSVVTTQPMAHLSNLVYGKRYYVFITNNSVACIDTTWFEFCAGGDKCVDFGDIYSCFATGYYGRFNNPDENKGLVDYGPDDINSRHTVIDDTLATDPRTGGQLRCVKPGYYESVRLGNWDIGGEAESIVYEYDVDTTKSEILLLRYAAVLENPNHSPSMQPRFRISLLDENNNEIDPDCYAADFVSSDALGWNSFRYDTCDVLWKDWTSIGIDLAPLHGRRINMKLTTYDCNEMGHFGYAYFILECNQKEVHPSECGIVHSNTFTAPEGFRYEWYNIDSSNVILSTARTFSSAQNGIYKCRAHFLGSTGSNCYFEKTAVVGDIFPFANYEYEIIDTNGCDVVVQFYNRSCVSLDAEGTQQTSMECDGFVWDFGDGTVSYDKHPIHQFPSREFNISLTASLANGSCTDDTVQTILMRSPCIAYDTLYPEICGGDTFAIRDTVLTTQGMHTVRTEYSPDSIVTTFVFLTVHPTLDTNLLGGICDGNAYTFYGFNDSIEGDYIHAFTSIYGCDSIYRLHLQVASSYDTNVDRYGCTSGGFHYRDTVFWTSTVYTDSLLSIYSCDSVVTMNIVINSSFFNEHRDTLCIGDTFLFAGNYYVSSGTYVDSNTSVSGCDSVEVQHLVFHPRYLNASTEYICLNQTYRYRGQEYTPQLIVDSLLSVNACDSVVHIEVIYYDTTFRADGILSLDTINWTRSDSSLYGCQPLTLYTRDSSVSQASVIWQFGDGASSTDANAVHIYEDSGIYSVLHIAISPDGCRDTATFISAVQVMPLPAVDFTWEPTLPSNVEPGTDFINLTQPDDERNAYLWYFFPQSADNSNPADSSLEINPHYAWPEDDNQVGGHDVMLIADRYFITLRGDTLICTDTNTQAVNVVNIYLQFPNVVTPNGDGINDFWQVVNLVEFNLYPVNRLRIYNRWGRLVYKRDNITSHDDDWNPNDCDCPDGTYFFRFDAQGEFGFIQHNGPIEVIRK